VNWGLGGGNGIGVPPIVNFGNTAQKAKFLPGVADGSIRFCLGITEPDGIFSPCLCMYILLERNTESTQLAQM
jgi:alkylation response protein AidB-like acyl-CoA dehydrogenase